MIYTVHCDYNDGLSEEEWNNFYSMTKLPSLISTTGFKTSQRFKSLKPASSGYLAVHTIENLQVLTSQEYLNNGGGSFFQWQKHITEWHRNVYSCPISAPEVSERHILILSRINLHYLQSEQGYIPIPLELAGLDMSHIYDSGYILPRYLSDAFKNSDRLDIYEPITLQLIHR